MLQVRAYTPDDYEMVCDWWRGHGFPVLNPSCLPATGLISMHENDCLAAGWLMMDNSCGFAMVAWAVSNPSNKFGKSHFGMTMIAQALLDHAKKQGYSAVMNSTVNEGIAAIFERNGFKTCDTGVTHQLAIIKESCQQQSH